MCVYVSIISLVKCFTVKNMVVQVHVLFVDRSALFQIALLFSFPSGLHALISVSFHEIQE